MKLKGVSTGLANVTFIMAFIVAIVFMSLDAKAHEWDGDAWATKQIIAYQVMAECVILSEKDYATFEKTCDVLTMAKTGIASLDELQAEVNVHPGGELAEVFVNEHFTNTDFANAAIVSLDVSVKGLKLMTARIELPAAKQQRDKMLKDAKDELNLQGA